MINYKIQKSDNKYNIYETQTEQILETHEEQPKAKLRVKHFNLGGGFDGHTPSFVLIDVKPYIKKSVKK